MTIVPIAGAVSAAEQAASKLFNAGDTRVASTGLSKLITDIYHSSLLLYGLTVVAVMVLMGLAIGFTMDFLISRLGIDLGRLEHRE